MELFVNAEGGLTTVGYGVSIGLMVVFLLAGLALSGGGERKGMSARHLAFCAMALALAFVMEEGLPQRFARVPIDFLAAAARQIMARLEEHRFPYFYQHLSYDHGSHLFVPMELRSTKFFRGDRGKNKAPGREDRMDSLEKTLEFVSRWESGLNQEIPLLHSI